MMDILNNQKFIGALGTAINVTYANPDMTIGTKKYYIFHIAISGIGSTQSNPDQYPGSTGNFRIGAFITPVWNANNINGIFLKVIGVNRTMAVGVNVTKAPNPPPHIPEVYHFIGEAASWALDAALEGLSKATVIAFFASELYYGYTAWASSFDYGYSLSSTATTNNEAHVWLTVLTTGTANSEGIYKYSASTAIEVGIPVSDVQPGLSYTVTVYTGIYYWWANYGNGEYVKDYLNISFTDPPTSGGGSGGRCVFGATPILRANGTYILAKDITPGAQIMSYNFTTNSLQPAIVTSIDTNRSQMLIINGYLMLDLPQKVYTERGYVMAENLTTNVSMFDIYTDQWDPVYSITEINGTFTMYDFTLNVNGNYIAWAYIMDDACYD